MPEVVNLCEGEADEREISIDGARYEVRVTAEDVTFTPPCSAASVTVLAAKIRYRKVGAADWIAFAVAGDTSRFSIQALVASHIDFRRSKD